MENQASFTHILNALNSDFFGRVVLASLEAIYLLNTKHGLLYKTFHVGAGGDKSTGADLLVESIFCKFLLPFYHVDSEESGLIQGNHNVSTTVILDPLDGSSNFNSNIPYYGASLALCDSSGRVLEACVVNYVTQEIAYLNERLLEFSRNPYVFKIGAISYGGFLHFKSETDEMAFLQNCNQKKFALSYYPMDFSSLFTCCETDEQKYKDVCMDMNDNEAFLRVQEFCAMICDTQKYLPEFNRDFLYQLFKAQMFVLSKSQLVREIAKCGIFEKSNSHYEWVKFLHQIGCKFRSLGATALSLGFSFRYLFVLLPDKVRRYDGMAGFYLAQNQIIYGNVQAYSEAIPVLQDGIRHIQHIIITANSDIANKFIGR